MKFSGSDRETRARWGVAPYYLARVHAVERGERHDSRRARDRWRTAKDPADVGDFGADAALAADDEKIYSLQWFVPLDALVAVCPTANAYLGEAAYPLAQVCDVKANEQGRVELAVWKPPSFDSTARGDGEKKTYDGALACVAPRLYARQEFAETNLDETELCHFYDDRDLDEDVGVSTRSRYVWRFTFDPHTGFWPDPKKLRRDICCKMGSVHGTCAFNNFTSRGAGVRDGDGCDRAHHLLCVGIDPKESRRRRARRASSAEPPPAKSAPCGACARCSTTTRRSPARSLSGRMARRSEETGMAKKTKTERRNSKKTKKRKTEKAKDGEARGLVLRRGVPPQVRHQAGEDAAGAARAAEGRGGARGGADAGRRRRGARGDLRAEREPKRKTTTSLIRVDYEGVTQTFLSTQSTDSLRTSRTRRRVALLYLNTLRVFLLLSPT